MSRVSAGIRQTGFKMFKKGAVSNSVLFSEANDRAISSFNQLVSLQGKNLPATAGH